MLSSNLHEKVKEFIASDEAFTLMSSIKGTPAYWKKILFDVLAMVKQVGVPKCFMTLSSADWKWNELVLVIKKLHKLDLSEEDIENLSYHDRCRLLNSNTVLVASHFQHWVEVFFKEIVVEGPMGKIKYHAIKYMCRISSSWLNTCALFSLGGQHPTQQTFVGLEDDSKTCLEDDFNTSSV